MPKKLVRLAALLGMLVLAACGGQPSAGPPLTTTSPSVASATSSAATCTGQLTPSETEGPYFKAGSPRRSALVEAGMTGMRLSLTGRVLTRDCAPVVGARLDFWQANAAGAYDNSGYRLRGNQLSDVDGRYALQTIVPGLYPGRTEHIHVKVQPTGKSTLTTQLFFPGVSRNQQDSIFDARLLIYVVEAGSAMTATFDFTVDAG
jgi:protocatechuate 3,4-dioxygenase beta subunit